MIEKNRWPLDTDFLDSSLHVNFEKLAHELTAGFERHPDREIVVFYGCCHPKMEEMLQAAHTFRTEGQNCVEMLLGREKFMEELSNGAFFLLEDWAARWDEAIAKTFGGKPEVIREIFQLSSRYVLGLRTPCSGDFEKQAVEVSEKVGLPLRWMDVGLENLEAVMQQVLDRRTPRAKQG